MADKVYIYQKRWWNKFLNIINDDPEALEDLKTAHASTQDHYFDKYSLWMNYHNIPGECYEAIKLYLENPNLTKEEYMRKIKPPLDIIDFHESKWDRLVKDDHPRANMSRFKQDLIEDGYTKDLTY